MFDFAINVSLTPQGFYDKNNMPLTVPSNWAINRKWINGKYDSVLRPVSSFIKEMNRRGIKRFYVERSYAFGDILMLVAVAQYLWTLGYEALVSAPFRYSKILNYLNIPHRSMDRFITEIEKDTGGIKLDGVVELDHFHPKFHNIHRCFIYLMALGVNEFPKELPWKCDLSQFPEIEEDEFKFIGKKFVVFQGEGGAFRRSLPHDTIRYIIKGLNDAGINVAYIGNQLEIKENERTDLIFYKYNLQKLFSLIGRAKCLITMDSAPLWISHFTRTPVLALLNIHRSQERTHLHPLWPEGAIGIELNEMINHRACYGKSKICSQRIDCLKVSPEKLLNLLKLHILKFWEK